MNKIRINGCEHSKNPTAKKLQHSFKNKTPEILSNELIAIISQFFHFISS